MTNTKTIIIVGQNNIYSTIGGSLTVFWNMGKMLAQNGFEVIGVFSDPKLNLVEDHICPHFKTINFARQSGACQTLFVQTIQQYQPSLIIYFFHFLYDLYAGQNTFDIQSLLMCHTAPNFSRYTLKNNPHLSCVQVLLDSFSEAARQMCPNTPVVVIGNPVQQDIRKKDYLTFSNKKIIFLSRTDVSKGTDALIEAFSAIADKYKDWTLEIYGQCEPPHLLKDYQNLIKYKKMSSRIKIGTVVKNTAETLVSADFCVFPSYCEAFSLGLSEALSVGLPCIGFAKAASVNEMIIDNQNGFLVKDVREMSAKIEYLINFPEERERMGLNAAQRFHDYSAEKINRQWLDLIDDLICRRPIKENISNVLKPDVFTIDELDTLRSACKQKLQAASKWSARKKATKLSPKEIIKAYFLFPLYIYKIYKLLKNRKTG